MKNWDAAQYLKFEKERTQPAIDLANRLALDHPATVIDIGCGPGNSTNILYEKFPDAKILGVDSSPQMIEAAKGSYQQLEFQLCDAQKDLASLNKKFDLVFSNACIQWIPNHRLLLKNMMALLHDGGKIAVQTPMNYEEPIHQIIDKLSKSEKWRAKFKNPRIFHNLTQSEYFDLLSGLSSDFSMWQTTYFHRMNSHLDILEWYRGTGLRPYLDELPLHEKAEFEQEVYYEVTKEYPKQKNGEIIFRFPRFFFTATK